MNAASPMRQPLGVLLDVLDTFHLDGGVVQLVFSAHEVGDLRERLERLLGLDVGRHRVFALGNLPDMNVVDV